MLITYEDLFSYPSRRSSQFKFQAAPATKATMDGK